jgi:ABC-type dipeptide/oligopeptide/nickel transport system ATPase component
LCVMYKGRIVEDKLTKQIIERPKDSNTKKFIEDLNSLTDIYESNNFYKPVKSISNIIKL